MMHQQSMMVGDMIPVHSEIPVHTEEMNNVGYDNSNSYAYDDLFPALPHSQPPVQRNIQQVTNKLRVGSSLHTQVFHVPYEERKLDNANTFGEGESLRTCQSITKDTGAHIEISTSKDGSLTFLITGKHSSVLDARRLILTHFQQQASKQITIPKEHHRWILGKQGQKLKELEKVTATKISVPGIADNNETVTITGTKEGIEKAEHEIRVCSEEQSRKALERITVPKIYHPFIHGPFGERSAALSAETGARIHIPPASTQSDEIVIAGEKNGVLAAKAQIEQIYEEMAKKCSTVRVEVPKSQHKYVIGARGNTIQEILKETGVSVEMPPPDSPTGTITLHGPHNKIGLALSKVCEKANSVKTATVDAPTWIHKYIIGKNGSNIKKITQDFSKVHVDITHSEDKVKIDGPPEEVERAQVELDDFVKNLLATLTYVELTVDPKFFKHIIGKNGSNINRLKDETGVVINIIENEGNNVIRIEGSHQGVADAERELREMVMKLENERSKEVFVDHRYIKSLIGVRGDKIKEIREKFDRVLISLPDQGQKRSPIKLRGPQEDIEKCEKYLHKLMKEIAESSYVQEVPIFKQFHKFIIGKGGANLRKIRDETQTAIDLPAEGDDSDVITVRGKRENVEEAVKRIQQIHNEKANIVTDEVTIAPKYYNSLIGAGGKLIHSIMEECGGVLIKFPPADSDSDKVLIRGPIEDVEKAKQQLLAHASERELTSHTAHVRAKPEHHKFLIGKSGANIKKIREQTGARIVFPTEKDEDKEAIFIIGREEQVEAARKQLETAVAEISNVSEGEMSVDPRHHRHFVARRGEVLRRIADDCGGVQISFPRQGVSSDRVVLKGPKECIEAAKNRINEIIEDLEAKVTIECIIPQRHHRTVMGARGAKVKDITAEFDVQIKFPERDPTEGADIPVKNDESSEPSFNDVIRIMGRPENCEAAKKALLDQVPVTIDVEVPNDLHRLLAGQKRRELMQTYDVHILMPPNEDSSDIVKVTGTPTNVEKAKLALADKIIEMEKEKEDRLLRSYELKFKVDPEYHPLVIGKGGSVITKIRTDYGVQINLPKRGEPDDDIITVQGYEDKAIQAKEAIMAIVHQLDNQYRDEVDIDPRVHRRLIGLRGKNIRRIMDEYKVDIRFPKQGDDSIVVITGDEDNVLDAKDHLLNLAEEYLQDVVDRYQRPAAPSLGDFGDVLAGEAAAVGGGGAVGAAGATATGGAQAAATPGFVVKGGPWEQRAPDTASTHEFPTMPGAPRAAAPSPAPTAAWGPRR
ncbi:vigilin [Vanessa cardui]|uniref:vigilin n=1 Tax=Vanessa cardui TaxID=171605 RepID=UPI001F12C6DB|nr:vigilin [Vanessa cardui]